ncbi:MAG: tyrosine--tRNA ligase [Archaeoglobus sp.]|nr:tyrosine--tRNA ligase [Archaeoglobus sp.]
MDVEGKIEIIKSFAEEIITTDELTNLFETNNHPVAYDGFEPSGIAHLPVGVYRPIILERLMKTGIRFKLLLADTFAWINNKLGGDIERIRDAGRYFIEVWKAAGVDINKVEVVWHKDIFDNPEYWKKVIFIAKNTSVNRTTRALAVAGRTESKQNPTAFIFYPIMQCADVFQLEVDICQLGMDQRKVNMLAREVAPTLGFDKPVAIHHPLLLGLKSDGTDKIENNISLKMSKSVPNSAIFVHDSEEVIRRKIRRAFCPLKQVKGNPVIDLIEKIIFNKFQEFVVSQRDGDEIVFDSPEELKAEFAKGELHPGDLKDSVANYINEIVTPIREHFEKNRKARELFNRIKRAEITR